MEPLRATLLFALCAAASTTAGRALFARLLPGAEEADRTLGGAALGLGLLSAGAGVLAICGVLRPAAAFALLALLAAAGAREWAPLAAWARGLRPFREEPLLAAAVALLLGLAFWACWVPPHQYDSLLYHLELAQRYRLAGSLAPEPANLYSYFPQNGELLFALALCLGSDLAAQMLMWWSAALSLCWIHRAARRAAPEAAWTATALLAAHTSFLLLASTTYVEPLMALWTTAAALAFMRWRAEEGAGWLVASALFAGLGLGSKYTAAITAAILGAWTVAEARRRGRRWDALVFGGAAFACVAPWLWRDARLCGDPVYPFLRRLFAGSESGLLDRMAVAYAGVISPFAFGARWRDLLGPGPGGVDVLGGLGWRPTVMFLPLAAWAARRDPLLRRVGVFCVLYAAAWYATGAVVRFLTALLPLLCLLEGAGLRLAMARARPRWAGACLGAGAAGLCGYQLMLALYVHVLLGTPRVLLGAETRDQFLARLVDYYPCARFADRSLPANAKLLLLGEQRGYYVERPFEAENPYAPDARIAWADSAGGPGALAARLRDDGFTHLLVVPREARRLGTFRSSSPRGLANWSALAAPARLLFRGRACSLYGIEGGGGG